MLKVVVTTASLLPEKTAEVLKKAVAKKHGAKVQYEFRVDPAVIGGIKVVIGSQAIDATIAGKLALVQKQLLAKV